MEINLIRPWLDLKSTIRYKTHKRTKNKTDKLGFLAIMLIFILLILMYKCKLKTLPTPILID